MSQTITRTMTQTEQQEQQAPQQQVTQLQGNVHGFGPAQQQDPPKAVLNPMRTHKHQCKNSQTLCPNNHNLELFETVLQVRHSHRAMLSGPQRTRKGKRNLRNKVAVRLQLTQVTTTAVTVIQHSITTYPLHRLVSSLFMFILVTPAVQIT